MKIASLSGLVLALLTMLIWHRRNHLKVGPATSSSCSRRLRYGSVEPAICQYVQAQDRGVDFTNSHSLYPTITTVNASAIATGHYIGDTGDFGNTLYAGTPPAQRPWQPIARWKTTPCWRRMNERSSAGNYLNEGTLVARARAARLLHRGDRQTGAHRIQDSTAAADGSENPDPG